ncbi:MAG: hypothetical protein FWC12_12495, partial [Treponema sp.]|nr:hypothetical protein [Treponema sp.]
QQPTANSQQPTANSQQPTANSQQPTANSQQPTAHYTVYLNLHVNYSLVFFSLFAKLQAKNILVFSLWEKLLLRAEK